MDMVPEGGANYANMEYLQNTNAMQAMLSVAGQTNQNLSPAQRELANLLVLEARTFPF